MLPTILIVKYTLLLLLVSVCNGTGKEKMRYTKEEEKFLIKEVAEYPGDILPLHGKAMWNTIAGNFILQQFSDHNEVRQVRTPEGLRLHFLYMLRSKKKGHMIPDSVIQRLPEKVRERNKFSGKRKSGNTSRRSEGDIKRNFSEDRYNSEEDKLIIDYVSTYPVVPVPIHGHKMWKNLSLHFKEKRNEDSNRFPFERTTASLRYRFRYILSKKFTDQERKQFEDMFRTPVTTGPRDTEVQMDVYRGRIVYTEQEDAFIINELLQPSCTSLSGWSTWRAMALKHEEERRSNTPGFVTRRTYRGIRMHFYRVLTKQDSLRVVLTQKFPELLLRASTSNAPESPDQDSTETTEGVEEDWEAMINELQNASVGTDLVDHFEDNAAN